MVRERIAAGDGCIETALRCWDGLLGKSLADPCLDRVKETELCGLLAAAQAYFGALFALQGLGEREIGERCRAFSRRFREQYGSDRCSELKPKSGCGGFTVDGILFALQYLYQENEKK